MKNYHWKYLAQQQHIDKQCRLSRDFYKILQKK